ncbi:aminoglycoside 3'-phosphotransferase [Sphaerisporangium rufum]|uniref:aminoglycoside 3'-phosphotransferase n=1 Tax=Sphaerisporangium rufum TaxID=1381558 RepID=UPI0019509B81|nr:aminoglycoside 3'-phosphotransferase [Sphaerisporangium rufum]
MIAHRPLTEVPVPGPIAAIAGGDEVRAVWRNERDGLTFELTGPHRRRFAKWAPAGSGLDLAAERERLAWAVEFTAVPRVLEWGSGQGGEWLVTAALPGDSAVSGRWPADPAPVVAAIGHGLRALHEALPVASCPFSWGVPERVARARAAGPQDAERVGYGGLSPAEALAALERVPPVDRAVVCHGDACAPNTLVDGAGRWVGHVDLGELGVADRWADLAVASWSLDWNYGPGWEPLLLESYGVAADPERIAYYRLLWDMTP